MESGNSDDAGRVERFVFLYVEHAGGIHRFWWEIIIRANVYIAHFNGEPITGLLF